MKGFLGFVLFLVVVGGLISACTGGSSSSPTPSNGPTASQAESTSSRWSASVKLDETGDMNAGCGRLGNRLADRGWGN